MTELPFLPRRSLLNRVALTFACVFSGAATEPPPVGETHFLIPDIAVEDKTNPIRGRYPGPEEPVALCIEIKSPPGRIGKLFAKCEDYHAWGVPHCWIFDPDYKLAWEYAPDDLEPRKVQETIAAGIIQLSLADVFRGL